MRMQPRSPGRWARSTSAALALAAPALAQGQLWVVDDGGGAGVDFTDVQPAVDAAAEGDTILIRPGNYTWVTIDAKSLVLIGEIATGTAYVDSLTVRNLAADQAVALRGLYSENWFEFKACLGPILGEELLTFSIRGSGVVIRPTLLITDCAELGGVNWEWQAADGMLGKARWGGI
jgi:hypothetical protein